MSLSAVQRSFANLLGSLDDNALKERFNLTPYRDAYSNPTRIIQQECSYAPCEGCMCIIATMHIITTRRTEIAVL